MLHVASSHWLSPGRAFQMLSLASELVQVVEKTQYRRLGNYIQSSAHTVSLHRQTTWVWRNKSGALTGVACLSLPAILALAEEIRHQVSTCPSVIAGVGATVVDVWQRQCNLLRVAAHKCTVNPFIKYSSGAVGLFSGKTSHVDLLISQWSPSQPSAQMHWYTLTLSMQVPPLWHGLLSQSLMSETEDGEHDLGVADPSPLSCVCRI